MTDGVIKGDGTSRLAKASGWPETYEGFKALAESSGIPLDLIFNSSGWQQLPTFLSKATLLQDFTAQLLGLDPDDNPTVDDAFLNTFLTASGSGLLKIQVYETGTKTPISGVRIVGVTGLLGEDLYADENGLAIGLATSETSSCRVGTDYIDLTGQTTFTGDTPAQKITNVILYATRVSNPRGKIETFTISTQRMFTDKVKRVDVHCVGGGAGGATGSASSYSGGDGYTISGGLGGGGGASSYRNNISVTPNQLYSIVVGNAGTKGVFTDPGNEFSSKYGTNGGASSAFGVTASGGKITGGGGTGGSIDIFGPAEITEAKSGNANTIRRFGESSQPIAGGGDGGGGGAYVATGNNMVQPATGGTPYGGSGGAVGENTAGNGSTATGYGGGGGGGTANNYLQKSGDGGAGRQGVVYVRWWY